MPSPTDFISQLFFLVVQYQMDDDEKFAPCKHLHVGWYQRWARVPKNCTQEKLKVLLEVLLIYLSKSNSLNSYLSKSKKVSDKKKNYSSS